MNTVYDLAYLCACAVKKQSADPVEVKKMDLEALYQLAAGHSLTAIACAALEQCGVLRDCEPVLAENFREARDKSLRKNILLSSERVQVCSAMEQQGIWYMPMKGSVLQTLYPDIGMRQMSDVDILFDPSGAENVRDIMKDFGFSISHYGTGVDDAYEKEPVSRFEMHRRLFSDLPHTVISGYYQDVKERLIQDENNQFGYHFSDEDFYLYIVAHEYKHYSGGGTGLRSLLDIYVYWSQKENTMGQEYLYGELDKLGIREFEEKNRKLAFDLFNGEPLTDDEQQMLDYILSSGSYGTIKNRIENRVNTYGGGTQGRLRYFWNRAVLPMSSVRDHFPLFYRYKILLPLLPFYRFIRGLASRRTKMFAEFKYLVRSHK